MGLVFNRDTYDLPLLLFEKLALDRAYSTWRHATWRSEVQHLEGLSDVAFHYSGQDDERSVRLDRRTGMALISLDRHGRVDLWVAASDDAALVALMDEARTALTPAPEAESHEVPVRFWTMAGEYPSSVVRVVTVPTWSEIRHNYAHSVTETLDRLMARSEPPVGGQLMLWHGPPGTGKTHAIRALIREWRGWLRAEYVVDPERFFGGSANYIMSLILGDDESLPQEDQRWRLLIFEDTGELLSADAKERMGQGLSRLLNTVDGLLGQGLRIVLLMTTNDELGRLHPAVTRPGRSAVNLRFGSLDQETAGAWMTRYGVELPDGVDQPTLAELFAILEGNAAAVQRPPSIGFGAPTK